MKKLTVGPLAGWVLASTAIGVLVVPSGATAQAFALEEQVRQQDAAARQRDETERNASVPSARVNASSRHASDSRTFTSRQNAIERAQWTQAVERFTTLVTAKAPRADAASTGAPIRSTS